MKILWKILTVIIVIIIGAGITCGGNILIAGSQPFGNIIESLNDMLGLGSEPYLGPNLMWIIWFAEIILLIAFSIWFFFWKYDTLTPKGKQVTKSTIRITIVLLFILPQIYTILMMFVVNGR